MFDRKSGRPSRARAHRAVTTLAASATMAIGAVAAPGGGSATAATTSISPTFSTVTWVATSTPATSAAATTTAAPRVQPLLRRPAGGSGAAGSASAPTAASSLTSTSTAAARVLANFDGVNALQSRNVNGFDVEPPDEGMGAGNGYVVNIVNLAGIIFSGSGRRLVGPFSMNSFFHEPATAFTSDPRVYYDPASKGWFATELETTFGKPGVTESHLDIAVNSSGDPRTPWQVYRLNTTNTNHFGCPCLPDYPILGIDADNIYISTNEFTQALNNFNGAQLYAISKSQLLAGAPTPRVAYFPNLSIAGTPAYHLQPAVTIGNPGVEYLMNSLDPFSTFDNRLGVWALTNPQSVSTGRGSPTLSSTVIHSEAYGFPPNAITPPGYSPGVGEPTTGVVASDFDAMQEVQYINGHLIGALDTGVTIPGETAQRAGIAWFDVHPSVSGATIGTTGITRQGYLARSGEYLLYPHINMVGSGAMAIVFSMGGPATFLSAAYATMAAGSAGFGAIRLAAAGVAPDNGFTGTQKYGGVGRWGDYSAGEIVPGTNRVWLATQYIPNNGDHFANWGNRIFELALP